MCLLFCVVSACAFTCDGWVEVENDELEIARLKIEGLLEQLGREQNLLFRLAKLKRVQKQESEGKTTCKLTLLANFLGVDRDCLATIIDIGQNQNLNLKCGQLQYNLERTVCQRK